MKKQQRGHLYEFIEFMIHFVLIEALNPFEVCDSCLHTFVPPVSHPLTAVALNRIKWA